MCEMEWPWIVSATHGDGPPFAEVGDRFVGKVRNGVARIDASCRSPANTAVWRRAVAHSDRGTNLIRGELDNGAGFVIQRISQNQVVCSLDYPDAARRRPGGWTGDEGDLMLDVAIQR